MALLAVWAVRLHAWLISRAVRDERGQGTVEYALVIGVGVVLAIGALTAASPNIANIVSQSISKALALLSGGGGGGGGGG